MPYMGHKNVIKNIHVLVALFFLGLPALSAFSQEVDTAWVRRFNGSGNGDDKAVALAVDDSGNVYVTGSSFDSATGFDYCTIKYLPNGDTEWVRRYNGPANENDFAAALALDDSGNVCVTGTSGNNNYSYTSDFATIKYSPNGDTLWVRRFSNCENNVASCDSAVAIAVDNLGFVYVTGFDMECGLDLPLSRYVTIKYSPDGNTQWVNCFGSLWYKFARALALGTKGDVYVTGSNDSNSSGGQADYLTIKYGSSGNFLGKADYNSPTNGNDFARAIAVDSSSNIYITGESAGGFATIKYDSLGNRIWTKTFSAFTGPPFPGVVGGFDLKIDKSGDVYVVGQIWDIEYWIWYTIKYDSVGNQLWYRYGGFGFYQPSFALDIDTAGNAYALGGESAYGVVKYDPQGNVVWSKYDSATPKDIGVDQKGNLYVTGFSVGNGTGNDYATVKYSPFPQLKGDLNLDGVLSTADAVLSINCVFLGEAPPAAPAACDLNCNGKVTAADVVILLLIVFSSASPPC